MYSKRGHKLQLQKKNARVFSSLCYFTLNSASPAQSGPFRWWNDSGPILYAGLYGSALFVKLSSIKRVLSVLILVQTICKCYQKTSTTKVAAS